MKKLVYCFLCFVGVTMFMDSCKSEQTKEAFNDSIQGTFFGVSFGADKDELVKKFAERDLILYPYLSTEEFLVFYPAFGGQRYSFGGLNWKCLNVGLSNGKFYYIQFYNSLKDKAEALEYGQSLLKTISAKYKLSQEEPKDSTTYLLYRGKSKKESEREVTVYVSRYEAVDETVYYGAFLLYIDKKYEASVSDEL